MVINFVILYTISSGGVGSVMIFNKSKLKIIMSCQAPIVRVPQIVFCFRCVLLKPTAIKHWKQRQHIELLVSTFWSLSRLLCFFFFWFYLRFCSLKFLLKQKKSRALKAHRPWLGEMSFFEKFSTRPPESMFQNSLENTLAG